MSPKRRNEKAARDAWTPERRKDESDKRKVRQAKVREREKAARTLRSATPPTPSPVEPRRTLIHDDRPDTIERRRFDCAHLSACEDSWVRTYSNEQAKCLGGCRGYEQREFPLLVSIGRASGISLG